MRDQLPQNLTLSTTIFSLLIFMPLPFETLLTPEHADGILANTIPEGYTGIHVPRVGRRGGGIAAIHRSTICVNRLPIVFESLFFEHLSISLTVNTVFVKIAIMYRPPSVNCPKFLTDPEEASILPQPDFPDEEISVETCPGSTASCIFSLYSLLQQLSFGWLPGI
jgi:hypothetical protein